MTAIASSVSPRSLRGSIEGGPKFALFLSLSLLLITPVMTATNSTQPAQEDTKNVLVELDKSTWISNVNWNPRNSSNIKVTVYSDIPKPVGIQEIPDYTGRSGSFSPMKQVTLNEGKNVISLPVNGRGGLSGMLGIAITDSNDGAFYRKEPNSIPEPKKSDVIFLAIYGSMATFATFKTKRFMAKFKLKRGYIRE